MKILISGEGGQGVQKLAEIISYAAYGENYNVSYIPHYGVEMRMGISFAYIVIKKNGIITHPKYLKADILASMTTREMSITESFIDKNTRVINAIELNRYLKEHSFNPKSLNMLVLGIIIKELNTTNCRLDSKKVKHEIISRLGEKQNYLKDNLGAYDLGLITDTEIYSKSLKNVKKPFFQTLIDKDSIKTHIRFPNLCKGCGLCLVKCPSHALSWSTNEIDYLGRPMPKVDINKCTACEMCQNICPDMAIKILKKR